MRSSPRADVIPPRAAHGGTRAPAALRVDSAPGAPLSAGDVPWHLQETQTECGGVRLVARAGALMSSAGEKTSRKDYSEVLEVRDCYGPF